MMKTDDQAPQEWPDIPFRCRVHRHVRMQGVPLGSGWYDAWCSACGERRVMSAADMAPELAGRGMGSRENTDPYYEAYSDADMGL